MNTRREPGRCAGLFPFWNLRAAKLVESPVYILVLWDGDSGGFGRPFLANSGRKIANRGRFSVASPTGTPLGPEALSGGSLWLTDSSLGLAGRLPSYRSRRTKPGSLVPS
jgi:hypothetical protein